MTISRNDLTTQLHPIRDIFLSDLKTSWFRSAQKIYSLEYYVCSAQEWFRSTKINDIQGWDAFACVDAIMGCTHFIESLLLKHALNVQVLPYEYAYYTLMGIHGTEPGNLKPGVPLIVSLPNWKAAGIRPDWNDVLHECEQKNIPVHIDMAWITTARSIEIDLDHPQIQSFAMSISKYNLSWNRIGLRWCRQRTMDSVTMFNKWQPGVNGALMSCGVYMMDHIPRDYGWNTYGNRVEQLCHELGLDPTNIVHVAKDLKDGALWGIGTILGQQAPLNI